MCTVEKILIKGIRSFSPDNSYIIEFYRPLTIIVGSNGAGKTTIIECLRNATTGELPPNTRQGQGFVHDPKVAGETEVKGQIKLQFRTATGSPIIVTRSFLLTQKKTALQFKSLDAVMTCNNKDTGARETLTYRCADLDRIVPPLMGVSKAVLENVVFVHQEESNWPLAEGKVLKDKFDDIFAATKYTKALEALRKLRTEKAQHLKELKLRMETLKVTKDRAVEYIRERDTAQSQIANGRAQLSTFETKIRELEERRTALTGQLAELDRMAGDVTAKRGQLEMLAAQNREREGRFKAEQRQDFEESDEVLQHHLATADATAAEQRDAARRLEAAVGSLRISKEALADQFHQDSVRHGQLAGEAATAAANVAERDRAIRATAVALALPLPEGAEAGGGAAVASPAAAAFAEAVGRRVRELEGRVQALRVDARGNDARMSSAVDGANAGVARAQEGVRLKRGQIQDNNTAISNCGAQIQNSQFTTADADTLKQDAAEADEVYRRKQAEEAGSDHARQAAEHRSTVEASARRVNELRAERQRAASAQEGQARLRLKRQDLKSREEKLSNVVAARRLDLMRALELQAGEPLPELAALRPRAEAVLARLRAEEAERLRRSQAAHQQAQTARTKLSARAAELARCRQDVARLRGELRSGISAATLDPAASEDDYNNRVAAVQATEAKRRQKLTHARAFSQILGFQRDHVDTQNNCPTCRRGFSAPEREECLGFIDSEMQSLPTSIREKEESVAALHRQLEALRSLQPAWVRLDDLRQRLPELEAAERALQAEAAELEEKAESCQLDYAEVTERAKECARLAQDPVWVIDRMAAEVEALRKEVSLLDGGGPAGPAARSVSEIDSELEAVEAAKQAAEVARDAAMARASRLRDEVMSAQRAAMQAQQRAMEAAAAASRVGELQSKMRELEAATAALEGELRAATAALAPLEAERDRLVALREEARRGAAAELQAAEEKLRDAQLQQAQLAARLRVVAEYEARGRAAEQARMGEALEALRGRMEAEAAALRAREEELADIRKSLLDNDAVRRDVADFLELRGSMRSEADLAAQVQELEGQAAQIGDQFQLQRQLQQVAEQRDAQRSRQDQLRGTIAAAQQAASSAQAQLNNPDYRDIHRRFREQQVAVKTTDMAMSDLDKYYKALEKALLVFHTTKMADINKIVKEMWQKTYRGQDIDYIQIKADNEGVGARSYNYRVVMYSGAAELEMRGRCSAGQKVLACLIIRLALAETFCLNCGILALDEPTTNLDAENSASLAEALRALMVSRAAQENFQLIVITHDERFAKLIGTREYVENLWRVTKDPQQHTQVLPEEVGDE